MTYTIIITKEILELYAKYYFTQHPKARNVPIDRPTVPSINSWCILQRQSMNALKQKWKSFGIWLVNYYGYSNLMLEDVDLIHITEFTGKRRRDADNYNIKFLLDGLVEAGMIKDDCSDIVKSYKSIVITGREEERTVVAIRKRVKKSDNAKEKVL